jgi:hypothetical protein
MTIGASLFLIAVGAILRWAVTATVSGLNLHTVGTIVFIVGLVGLAVSLIYAAWWARRDTYVETTPATADRRVPPPAL